MSDERSPAEMASLTWQLRLEQATNRLRSRILTIRDGAQLFADFNEQWVAELNALGVPAYRLSVEMPAATAGFFQSEQMLFFRASGPQIRLDDCPWVRQAWEGGTAVCVDPARMAGAGFDPAVRSVVEVPLPVHGSVGVSSRQAHAFDAAAIATIQALAPLCLEAVERVHELEDLRLAKQEIEQRHSRLEAAVEERTRALEAVHRIRERVWRMNAAQDIKQVLLSIREALTKFGIPFRECSVSLVEAGEPGALPVVRSHSMAVDGAWQTQTLTLEGANRSALLRIWKAGQPAYRRDLLAQDVYAERAGVEAAYGSGVRCILDIPFDRGTLAVNSDQADAFTPAHIDFLQRVAEVTGEALHRLDDLEELAQTQEQLLRSQRLESVGQLAGGIAHDLNNVLTVVLGCSDFLLLLRGERLTPEAVRQHVQPVKDASARATALIRQLLAFSRRQILVPEVADINHVISQMQVLLRRMLRENTELRLKLDPSLGKVEVDVSQFEQILMNLTVNARDAMPDGGWVTIETENVALDEDYARQHVSVDPGDYIMLAVSDTGVGMDRQTRTRIFEPFFTTKPDGSGLGLSTVYGIVKQSRGNIWVYSEPGQGTTFKIYLPRTDRDVVGKDEGEAQASPEGNERILLVEDDDLVREMARQSLEQYGYQVHVAEGPEAALRLATDGNMVFDLIVTDVVMPKMSGPDLAKALARHQPQARVLYVSGYTASAIHHHGLLDAGVVFVPKPFRPMDLARRVREVLDS